MAEVLNGFHGNYLINVINILGPNNFEAITMHWDNIGYKLSNTNILFADQMQAAIMTSPTLDGLTTIKLW